MCRELRTCMRWLISFGSSTAFSAWALVQEWSLFVDRTHIMILIGSRRIRRVNYACVWSRVHASAHQFKGLGVMRTGFGNWSKNVTQTVTISQMRNLLMHSCTYQLPCVQRTASSCSCFEQNLSRALNSLFLRIPCFPDMITISF